MFTNTMLATSELQVLKVSDSNRKHNSLSPPDPVILLTLTPPSEGWVFRGRSFSREEPALVSPSGLAKEDPPLWGRKTEGELL